VAIYRPPKPRWPLAVGVGLVCTLIGFGIGLAVGGRDPSPVALAEDLHSDLVAAAGSLEVAEIEYSESVSNGAVTRQAEYDGALAAIESSESRYQEVEPALQSLDPSRADEISGLYDECSSAMQETAEPTDVTECLKVLRDLLKGET
jgi:hypothetical protein